MVRKIPVLPNKGNWVDYPLADVVSAWGATKVGVCKSDKSIKLTCPDGVRTISFAQKDAGKGITVNDFPNLRVREITHDKKGEAIAVPYPVVFTPGNGEEAAWFDVDAVFNAKVEGKTV